MANSGSDNRSAMVAVIGKLLGSNISLAIHCCNNSPLSIVPILNNVYLIILQVFITGG